ncbi:purine-cytosine permease [Purpureocillium lavendulum]|uniref:Purine-cytosine permease n=1 Tax=Purpureocillium lavendulum TaxID=1247861 RepID=A0AB34FFQ6_9HYPO|nr:purine-cytosine permease [Purpureocillium lavendulum]
MMRDQVQYNIGAVWYGGSFPSHGGGGDFGGPLFLPRPGGGGSRGRGGERRPRGGNGGGRRCFTCDRTGHVTAVCPHRGIVRAALTAAQAAETGTAQKGAATTGTHPRFLAVVTVVAIVTAVTVVATMTVVTVMPVLPVLPAMPSMAVVAVITVMAVVSIVTAMTVMATITAMTAVTVATYHSWWNTLANSWTTQGAMFSVQFHYASTAMTGRLLVCSVATQFSIFGSSLYAMGLPNSALSAAAAAAWAPTAHVDPEWAASRTPVADDVEKRAGAETLFKTETDTAATTSDETGRFAGLQRLASKLHVEKRGIERVPEEERNDSSYLNISTMWLSANLVVPSFTIGVLGTPLFGLGFLDSALVIIFFNAIAVLTVCFFSTFGPAFGLRQMVLSRFWFGFYGVKLIALFNLLSGIGWSAANIIVGAQLINAASHGSVPGWAGILIIALCTLTVVLFGYKLVHLYEYYSWLPTLIVFLVVLGVFAKTGDFRNIPMGVGSAEVGKVLTFGSVVYGFGTGYTPLAADYTVYQPSSRPRRKVFLATWLGIFPTLLFTELLGAAVATATSINGGDNSYQKGYEEAGVGGLLASVLFPHVGRFGQFCLVVLALSIVANNCPNIYSVSLTLMILGRSTARVYRWVWVILGSCAYVAIAIPGYSSFEDVLESFMHIIGYWIACYSGVALCDHVVFKRSFSQYDPSIYDKPRQLPLGISAVVAFVLGIVGMVLGMSQPWYTGPVAKAASGDLGFELAFCFAAISYAAMRPFELKVFHR